MRKIFLLVGAAALALAACGKKEEGDTAEAATAETAAVDMPDEAKTETELRADFEKLAAENLAASNAFLDENKAREDVKVTPSGLQYMVLKEGPEDGLSPVSTDLVVVHYVGTLTDGVEFDSSRARGAAAQFRLNGVIPGWTEGLQLMSEGDNFRFFVPPELAYGARGGPGGGIGPNEALIFDVELIKVQNAARNLEAANAFFAENAKKAGVKTTESGLQYEILTEGDEGGESPNAESTVQIHFESKLVNGTALGSSYDANKPAEFPLNAVMEPWVGEALPLMSKGDKYRFYIPPSLAYGEAGTPGGPIGPNEALIFEVELLEVK
ncbi:FKBP-type peptidyl-prolyl cis-trans isomerase [Hyphococcus sp.]|uniref:FKBP-type peptidyl-prolyl cis-trans isomerase n=1 Tax=Hyphococcus sp. TaxID=2038636 RepID=UPI0035C6A149